jgi:Transglycosylase SLT domain
MSNSSRLHTIRVPWRTVCAALPAVALMGGGLALSAPVASAHNIRGVPVSSHGRAIVVPDQALTLPATAGIFTENLPVPVPQAPAQGLSKGAVPSSSSLMTVDSTGIPVRALEGYRRAASLVDSADPTCHLDWELLAAIGRVESDHGRFGGSQLNSAGVDEPAIIGVRLDGSNGTARIIDPAGFVLDGDHVYEHAVGPMQFLPSTWRIVGIDADGDGVKNPQSITDAATSAGIYLCSGQGDLSQPGDLSAAILRYNASDSYVRTVTAIAATYRLGVSALPPSDPAPAISAASTSVTANSATTATTAAPLRPVWTLTTATGQLAALPLGAPVAVPAAAAPALPKPAPPVPTVAVTAVPTVSATPVPTVSATPVPTVSATPVPPVPTATVSTPAPAPCLPAPTATNPAAPTPCVTATG